MTSRGSGWAERPTAAYYAHGDRWSAPTSALPWTSSCGWKGSPTSSDERWGSASSGGRSWYAPERPWDSWAWSSQGSGRSGGGDTQWGSFAADSWARSADSWTGVAARPQGSQSGQDERALARQLRILRASRSETRLAAMVSPDSLLDRDAEPGASVPRSARTPSSRPAPWALAAPAEQAPPAAETAAATATVARDGRKDAPKEARTRSASVRAASSNQPLLGLGPGAAEPSLVTHALTVQGPQQGLAMVTGRKQIENRGWRIPPGWYALHVGSQPLAAIGVEWCERMRVAWPEAPPERSLPSSKIVGLIHVSEQRKPGASLPKDHPQAIWAVGPICHVIDQAVELPRGIQHGGSKGLWEISEPARQRLLRQLSGLAIQSFEPLPRPEGSVIGR
ncbi:unnamed protein product, partial [Polarella glacialis]